MQLNEFKEQYLDFLLKFLWRQWSALGIAGYGENEESWVIDPEGLLLFSGTLARYDGRLFDEILDWLDQNERFINVLRLRNILKEENFESKNVIAAMAGKLMKERSGLKWKKLASYNAAYEEEPLFFLKSGKTLPVVGEKDFIYSEYGFIRNPVRNRGLSQTFACGKSSTLLLQLRALFGVNSRAETLLYLIVNGEATISEIADQGYYSWRSIQEVLFELGRSGILSFPAVKKGRVYYLQSSPWEELLLKNGKKPEQWICWPPLFRALEMIWMKMTDPNFMNSSPLEQAAEFRHMAGEGLNEKIEKAGFGSLLSSSFSYGGEEYLRYWMKIIGKVLAELSYQ